MLTALLSVDAVLVIAVAYLLLKSRRQANLLDEFSSTIAKLKSDVRDNKPVELPPDVAAAVAADAATAAAATKRKRKRARKN